MTASSVVLEGPGRKVSAPPASGYRAASLHQHRLGEHRPTTPLDAGQFGPYPVAAVQRVYVAGPANCNSNAIRSPSSTAIAACAKVNHFRSRSCRSGQCSIMGSTCIAKILTLHSNKRPLRRLFGYVWEPTDFVATLPTSPASSNASLAASSGPNRSFFCPTFWQNPTTGFPAGDQHDQHLAILLGTGQGGKLLSFAAMPVYPPV